MIDIEVNFNALCLLCLRQSQWKTCVCTHFCHVYEPENVVICCLFFSDPKELGKNFVAISETGNLWCWPF